MQTVVCFMSPFHFIFSFYVFVVYDFYFYACPVMNSSFGHQHFTWCVIKLVFHWFLCFTWLWHAV